MVKFKGFEIDLAVDGQSLKEYENFESVSTTPSNTVVRYVECLAGKQFELVHHAVDKDFGKVKMAGIKLKTFVDGVETGYRQVMRQYPYQGKTSYRLYVVSGRSYKQTFSFSDLTLSETEVPGSEITEDMVKKAGSIGTIEIKLERLSSVVPSSSRLKDFGQLAKDTGDVLSEKMLKGRATSHRTRYSEPEQIKISWIKTQSLDEDEPFLCFKFYYMSRACLQAIGVIPRSPSAVPLERRNVEELSRDQMMELINTQREQINSQTKIKQESISPISDRVKVESSTTDNKRRPVLEDDEDLSFVSTRSVRHKTSRDDPIDLTDE